MSKNIRSVPAGWIDNGDGSFSKPKGKELLFSLGGKPEPMDALSPAIVGMGRPAAVAVAVLTAATVVVKFTVAATPCPAPRMTRSDKWRNPRRPCVQRYFDFRDAVKLSAGVLSGVPDRIECEFYFPMPASWSDKKKREMEGKPHRVKPDRDNCEKAILDALFTEDGGVHEGETKKRWAYAADARVVVKLITF